MPASLDDAVIQPDAEPTMRGPTPGQRVFARYTLVAILGRGGMGVVWSARDETLGEDVALKFLPDAVRWDPGAFEDLKAETRRARQLTHPNIIRIHDFVEDATGAAISMELVDGRTLTAVRLARENKVLDPADIVPWLPQLCGALDFAHQQARVVHRDLKPSNIMLTREGIVKVGDFGIARSLADSITRVSMLSAGTLVYMSPQQAMGEEPTPADDIYALGATLYELLTGKPPFHTGDVRVQLFHRKPDSIASRRRALGLERPGAVSRVWEATIAACLAKSTADRPPTAGEAGARLSGVEKRRLMRGRAGRGGPSRVWSLALVAAGLLGLAVWEWRPRASGPATAWASDATRAVAAWNLDGDAADVSGRGFHLVGAGSTVPTTDRFGRVDRALHFNGNASLQVAAPPPLQWAGDEPFAVSVWVRPDAIRAEGNYLVGSISPKVGDAGWQLSLGERGRPVFEVRRVQEEGGLQITGPAIVRAGEWAHLAAVSDGRRARLFANGVLAGEVALARAAIGRRPAATMLRVGMADVYARWAYSGDMDDLRLWRRVLDAREVAALASREPPPRLAISRGVYSERDDLSAALAGEFGPGATLGDWEDLRRWHADDTDGWCDEAGLPASEGACLVQRAGERLWQAPRHYSMIRLGGTKPGYYLAHDELGGMTLALGSWYGMQSRALARLPDVVPRLERLGASDGGGLVRIFGTGEHPVPPGVLR